jgi:transcription initiation factor TFIIE subunit alpha
MSKKSIFKRFLKKEKPVKKSASKKRPVKKTVKKAKPKAVKRPVKRSKPKAVKKVKPRAKPRKKAKVRPKTSKRIKKVSKSTKVKSRPKRKAVKVKKVSRKVKKVKAKPKKQVKRKIKAKPTARPRKKAKVRSKVKSRKKIKAKKTKVKKKPVPKIDLKANPELYDFLHNIVGPDGMRVIEKIKDNEVSDVTLAEKMDLKANIIRKHLYALYEAGVVEYRRHRSKTGWYTYYWKLQPDRISAALTDKREIEIKKLQELLDNEKDNQFFECKNKCTRVVFDQAVEHEFKCPTCSNALEFSGGNSRVTEVERRISKLSTGG